jgi:hypothetical protein
MAKQASDTKPPAWGEAQHDGDPHGLRPVREAPERAVQERRPPAAEQARLGHRGDNDHRCAIAS